MARIIPSIEHLRLRPAIAALERQHGRELTIAALREAAGRLAGDAAWSGPAGRAAADLVSGLEAAAPDGPVSVRRDDVAEIMRQLMEGVAVRPPGGGHPRVFVWGLIEARLQRADLTILGGLNEGVWPGIPAPDPWLAPKIRAGRRLVISAHGNSIRALVKYLDNISDPDIVGLNIPNGIPLVYELDVDLKPIRHYYLGDAQAVAKAAAAVAAQGKA